MRQSFRPTLAFVALVGAVGAAPAAFAADYATVVSTTPVMAQVPVARQVCSQGSQYVQQAPSGAGAVIGAIAGGLLGNGVGGGFGRAAATGIGAVAGSVIGNQVEANTNPVSEVPVQRCQVVNRYESRTVGYDVVYEYAGQRYSTRMARDPGQRFAVNVQPADGGANMLPAPAYRDADAAQVPAAPAPQAAYYDPLPPPVDYERGPVPVYYGPSPIVYAAPVIGFGIGYSNGRGYRGGRHWR